MICNAPIAKPRVAAYHRVLPSQLRNLARGSKDKQHAMSQNLNNPVALIGIDIVKNSFHVVGPDDRGAIARRQK
jgi:hypothetical protein